MFSSEATDAHETLIARASPILGEGESADPQVVAPLVEAIDRAVASLDDAQMAELLMMLLHDAAHVHSIRTAPRPYNYVRMRERLLSDDGAAGQIPADEYV
jgi:hypothetical protein